MTGTPAISQHELARYIRDNYPDGVTAKQLANDFGMPGPWGHTKLNNMRRCSDVYLHMEVVPCPNPELGPNDRRRIPQKFKINWVSDDPPTRKYNQAIRLTHKSGAVHEFGSTKEVMEYLRGVSQQTISLCLLGKQQSVAGYTLELVPYPHDWEQVEYIATPVDPNKLKPKRYASKQEAMADGYCASSLWKATVTGKPYLGYYWTSKKKGK